MLKGLYLGDLGYTDQQRRLPFPQAELSRERVAAIPRWRIMALLSRRSLLSADETVFVAIRLLSGAYPVATFFTLAQTKGNC